MSYKLQHVKWKPCWHALTIWECIGELSEQQRGSGLLPPKAPAAKVNDWYHEAVVIANDAIEKMMQEVGP